MPFPLHHFLSIGYLHLFLDLSLLRKMLILFHHLCQHLGHLAVLATPILDPITNINFSLGLWSVCFLGTFLCPKVICVWTLLQIRYTLLAMLCSMRVFFLLLIGLILLMPRFFSLLLSQSLIGFLSIPLFLVLLLPYHPLPPLICLLLHILFL